jgi:hypothetical protein
LGGCALYAYLGHSAAGSNAVVADEHEVAFHPPLGKPKVVDRARVASIVRVQAPRVSVVEFRARAGTALLTVDSWYGREKFERLAGNLGVPLQWKL